MTKMDIDIERSVKATAQIFQSICSPDHFSFFMFDSFFVSFFCSSSGMLVIFVFSSSSSSMLVT